MCIYILTLLRPKVNDKIVEDRSMETVFLNIDAFFLYIIYFLTLIE